MNQQQIHIPNLSPTNKILLMISGGLFLLNSILQLAGGGSLNGILGLSFLGLEKGFLFQLFTYPFLGHGLFDVLINGLLLWFLGSELEQIWGRKRYLWFIGTSALGGGIIFLIVVLLFFGNSPVLGAPLLGFSGVVSAFCVAYAILFPDRLFTFMLLFPMKAKYFCFIMISLILYSGVFNSYGGVQAWGHLGTIAAGVLYMWIVSKPNIKALFETKGKVSSPLKKRKKNHLSIVKNDDDEKPPKYWH